MNIKQQRNFTNLSQARLRRARRLYKRLVTPKVNQDPRWGLYFAYRGINAGLWAESTGVKDVSFTLIRSAFNRYSTDSGWWEWCKDKECIYLWLEAAKYFKRTDSGWIQTNKIKVKAI